MSADSDRRAKVDEILTELENAVQRDVANRMTGNHRHLAAPKHSHVKAKHRLEALIAAAETKARIDGAKQFWLWLAPIQAAIFAGNITSKELDRRVREYSTSLRHPEREGA